jgi:hypothetical protein
MKKKNLSDLEKARGHFIKATTEIVIGSGFALKGIRNLLKEREGRQIVYDLVGNLLGRGANIVTKLADVLTQVETGSPKQRITVKKKIRKVKIE